jgi:hypothetical protein
MKVLTIDQTKCKPSDCDCINPELYKELYLHGPVYIRKGGWADTVENCDTFLKFQARCKHGAVKFVE